MVNVKTDFRPLTSALTLAALAAVATAAVATAAVATAAAPAGDPGVVEEMPGLVAFWTFGEEGGELRVSSGTAQKHALAEKQGPIPRVEGGPFSGFSAHLDGQQWLEIKHDSLGDLNISGPDAQVSMFAAVLIEDVPRSRTIAGIWSEGKGAHDDTGTRQYALLAHMPAYGGSRRLTPHISSEGGVTRRADGTPLPWNADYAAPQAELPEGKWCTVGFTYDSDYIRAYVNGVMEPRALDPENDNRTDRYFTAEGPDGKDRGMNPYYHGRGIFRYDPNEHAESKIPPSDFTVGARYAGGSMLSEAFRGKFGGLAVFDRALTDEEMMALHEAANVDALNQ
ncbi:hypothetical protein BH23VER1_BH23VER1_22910 [soil metagenome]